jgi:transposase
MTPRKPWTTAEVAKIRELGRHHDVHGIAQALGRTRRSVDSMICRLGISLVALRAWNASEDQTLRHYARKETSAQLGKRLKRSADAVRRRARELGISLAKRGQYHHAAKHRDTKRQQYRQLRADGMAQQTAARVVDVHPSTARRWESPR